MIKIQPCSMITKLKLAACFTQSPECFICGTDFSVTRADKCRREEC